MSIIEIIMTGDDFATGIATEEVVKVEVDAESRHASHNQKDHAGKHAGVMNDMREPDGGFTVDRDGKPITTGWSVGIEGSTVPVMASEIDTNRAKVRAVLVEQMKSVPADADGIGGWHDPATGIVHIDHVKVFPKDQHDAAKKFAEDNNQISMANLDAIGAGDWDNAIESIGGTGDLRSGSILDHAEAVDVQVLEAAVGDDRRGARGVGRPDSGSVVGGARFVDLAAKYAELRHATHNQKDHGRGGGGGYNTGTRDDGTLEVASWDDAATTNGAPA